MSGSIGANRIPSSAVKATVQSFIDKVLSKYPTFKSAKITGSYNIIPKDENGDVVGGQEKPEGHGDIDLVVELEGDRADMKKIKADFAAYLNSLSDDITVPFRAGRHTGKKTAGTGDIVITQYHIEGFPDLTVQIDNMIVSSQEESTYRTSFLDIPGPKQALLIGLAKTMCIEEDPNSIFQRLGIKDVPPLEENQEYEFVLSSKGLTLRIVTLDNFKEISRQDIWMSYKWSDVETLFKDYNINGSFKELLNQLASKQWKSQRSKNRIKGTFKSMLVIGAGEVGTPKGADKEAALEKVNQLLSEALDDGSEIVALYAGGFKPPHLAHFENAKFLSTKADKIIIYIGPKIREGVKITAQQSKAIWEIYAKYLDVPVEVVISKVTPILDTYEWIDANQDKVTNIITGAMADEMKKFTGIEKQKQKGNYQNVEVRELPVIVDKEDSKFSATDIRQSEEFLLSGKWIPSVVSQEDKQAIVNIVSPQKQDSVEDKMLTAVDEVFESFFPSKTKSDYKTAMEWYRRGKVAYDKGEKRHAEQFRLAALTYGIAAGMKEEDLPPYSSVKEGSSGTAIQPGGAIPSKDRASLEHLYDDLKTTIDPDKYTIVFNQDRIDIYIKTYSDVSFDGTPYQKHLPESVEQTKFNYTPYIGSILEYMLDQGMKIQPLPEVKIRYDEQEAGNFFGKTAYYDPTNQEVVLYVMGRHPKDVCRSFTHEMIHHMQNIEGRLGDIQTSNTNEDGHLQDIEKEAYLRGNMTFRNWEDGIKNK